MNPVPASSSLVRKLMGLLAHGESKSNNHGESKSNNHGARKGCAVLYVGKEGKRYDVPVKYLSYTVLQELMDKSQRDLLYDPNNDEPLVVACTTHTFDQLLKIFKNYR